MLLGEGDGSLGDRGRFFVSSKEETKEETKNRPLSPKELSPVSYMLVVQQGALSRSMPGRPVAVFF